MNRLLENDTIRLRPLEPEDLDLLYEWENDTSFWEVSSGLSPFSRFAIRQYIEEARQDVLQTKQLRLMIELKQSLRAVGMIDLYDLDILNQHAGIGILIDRDFQQQGLGYQSLHLIAQYAFTVLHLRQLYAYVASDNSASKKLFTKAGFEQTATLRQWLITAQGAKDVSVFQYFNTK